MKSPDAVWIRRESGAESRRKGWRERAREQQGPRRGGRLRADRRVSILHFGGEESVARTNGGSFGTVSARKLRASRSLLFSPLWRVFSNKEIARYIYINFFRFSDDEDAANVIAR